MAELQASRTLVKSGPELWAECSDAASLAKHLGEFGEITITKLEPENTVAWEGDAVSGTVKLEPAGWGTRVTLTAFVEPPEGVEPSETEEPALEPPAPPAPEPADPVAADPVAAEPVAAEPVLAEPEPVPEVRQGFLRRLFGGRRRPPAPEEPAPDEPVVTAAPESEADPTPEPAPDLEAAAPAPEVDAPEAAVLVSALDSLGTAHRRPFSRS